MSRRSRPGSWIGMGTLALAASLGASMACSDGGIRPVTTLQAGDTADQILFGVSAFLAPEGIRRNYLEADTAFFYQATGIYDLRVVTLVFYDESGIETSTLTADSGLYRQHTGAMEARGRVMVRSPDEKVLRTSVLRYDRNTNELSTDQPFSYETPIEAYEGDAFRSDPQFRNIVTDQPRGGQRGEVPGTMPLPGQEP